MLCEIEAEKAGADGVSDRRCLTQTLVYLHTVRAHQSMLEEALASSRLSIGLGSEKLPKIRPKLHIMKIIGGQTPTASM